MIIANVKNLSGLKKLTKLTDVSFNNCTGVSDLSSHAYAKIDDKVLLVELKQGFFNNNEINFGNADKLFEQIRLSFRSVKAIYNGSTAPKRQIQPRAVLPYDRIYITI